MRWTEERLRTQFPARVREERRAEGLDPDVRPTQEWLREHGYGGIESFARRNDMSVVEILEDICGFESPPGKPLDIDHAETRRLVEEWLDVEQDIFNQWGDRRVQDARTHFRTLADVAYDELGSTNLLRLVRSASPTDVDLIMRLFSCLASHMETQGAQSNYTRSLERWADYLALRDEIEDHKIDEVREMMGYTYERRSPEHELKPKQIRKCWRVTETLEEKALLVILTAAGTRRAEPTDVETSQLRLDRHDPYIVFDADRKTGEATVPIMAGVEVIEAWVDELEERDWWDGKWLFPSKKSRDGSRSPGWVNNTIEEIVGRAGVTFPDGEEPTPKSFRAFWYNHYIDARQEWLTKVEMLADEQGVSSSEIIDLHYLTAKGARDHFRKFAQSYFAAAFGDELVYGIEGVSEVREEERDDFVQQAIDDYTDDVRAELQRGSLSDRRDTSPSDDDDSGTQINGLLSLPELFLFGTLEVGQRTHARLKREWVDLTDDEAEWPTPREAAAPIGKVAGSLLLMGLLFAGIGFTIDPLATQTSLPDTTASAGLGLGLVGGILRVLWIDYCVRREEISFTRWSRKMVGL